MDIELIIYLIFLAIALLGRLLGKKKNQSPAPKQKNRPARPQKSFEELLQEFTNPEASQAPVQTEEVRTEPTRPQRSTRPTYVEEKSSEPFRFQPSSELKTLDEMVNIDDTRTTSKLASVDDMEEGESGDIQDMFNSPEDARKAVILGEILQRKYS